jgi:hypothetical protein
MRDRDPEIRARLARLEPPPRRDGFERELWERIQTAERAAARRWRLASVTLGAVAIAAIAAVAVLAATRGGGSTVDRTVSCATEVQGGVHQFGISAQPIPQSFDYATLTVFTGGSTLLLGVDTRFKGFTLGSACKPVKKSIPLARAKLPLEGVSKKGEFGSAVYGRCLLPGRVLIRMKLHLDSGGKPLSAVLAVRMVKKHRPVAFVTWSPNKAVGYLSPLCEQS